jgi:hypothetical protein
MLCKICNQEFENGWQHALTWSDPKGEGMSTGYVDRKHAEAIEEFMKDMFNREKMCPVCGGEVSRTGSASPDGDASWEIICDDCGFLFDED